MKTGNNVRKRADGRFEARYKKGRDASGEMHVPYTETVLDATYKCLQTMQKYGLQYTFFSMG